MFKKIENAISFKTKAGIVTIGIKSFMAHTPAAVKKVILAVCSIGILIAGYFVSNPSVLPQKYELMIIGATPILVVIAHSLGIKCPFDANGNPVNPPADQTLIQSLKQIETPPDTK